MKAFLKRTVGINLGLCALVLLVFFGVTDDSWKWTSCGLGVITSVVNLGVIGWLANRLLERGGVAAPLGIFTGKFALLLTICYVLVVVVKVDVVSFLCGLSTAYVALVFSAMLGVETTESEQRSS